MTEPRQSRAALWFVGLLVAASAFVMTMQFAQPNSVSWLAIVTPLYAAGMFVGAKRGLMSGLAAVVAAQVVGAIGIGAISGRWDWAFYGWLQVANITCLCVAPLIGAKLLSTNQSGERRVVAGGATAIAFFLLSNFSIWALVPAETSMYPKTISGLITCYYMGLPYLGRTLVACISWSLVLFSEPVLAVVAERRTTGTAATSATVTQ